MNSADTAIGCIFSSCRARKGVLLGSIVLAVGAIVATVMTAELVRRSLDAILASRDARVLICAIVGVVLAGHALRVAMSVVGQSAALGVREDMTNHFVDRVLRGTRMTADPTTGGGAFARLQDIAVLVSVFGGLATLVPVEIALRVGSCVFLLFHAPVLLLVALSGTAAILVLVPCVYRECVRVNRAQRAVAGETIDLLGERATHSRCYRQFDTSRKRFARVYLALSTGRRHAVDAGVVGLRARVLAISVETGILAAVAVIAARSVAQGNMSGGSAIASVGSAMLVSRAGAKVLEVAMRVAAVQPSIERLDTVYRTCESNVEELQYHDGGPAEKRVFGLRDVSISLDHKPDLLRGIDFDVFPGQWIAVIGANGAGKSTFVSFLAGLCDRASGSVLIGSAGAGANVATQLKDLVAVVSRDPVFVRGSMWDNLIGAEVGADVGEIHAALRDSCADEFVDCDSLQEVAVDGASPSLSTGQAARLGIARALLMRPRVLVLDEALDVLSDEQLSQVSLGLRRRGLAVVVVTHRADVVRMCEVVAELQKGKLSMLRTP
ncbi:MAG: ABC transporter ATP-binding protein [Comamonadaceae bacterium]|nr:MAG: ABC transporter ATP-binding protein [Comamonadaceae bacterium]